MWPSSQEPISPVKWQENINFLYRSILEYFQLVLLKTAKIITDKGSQKLSQPQEPQETLQLTSNGGILDEILEHKKNIRLKLRKSK